MDEQTRKYYLIMERPPGSQLWTFAKMACEPDAADRKAIEVCKSYGTCTRIVTVQLPRQADAAACALLLNGDEVWAGINGSGGAA
jgi:hypothetical protein